MLDSVNEPGELSQWQCCDDSIINIVLTLLLLLALFPTGALDHFGQPDMFFFGLTVTRK